VKVRLVRVRVHRGGAVTGPIGRNGRVLGEMEEYFFTTLVEGRHLPVRVRKSSRSRACSRTRPTSAARPARTRKSPPDMGGKFPLSTYLADGVRELIADPSDNGTCRPGRSRICAAVQRDVSLLPQPDSLLVETFPRGGRYYLVCYPFEGRACAPDARHAPDPAARAGSGKAARLRRVRLLHSQSGAWPTWAASISSGRLSLDDLFDEDMLGDDLEAWLDESALMRRTFRNCAIISGLIERRAIRN